MKTTFKIWIGLLTLLTMLADVPMANAAAQMSSQMGQNFLVGSEQFGSGWTLDGVTVSADAIMAPNGTHTADRLVETVAVGSHRVYRTASTALGLVTASIYAKAAERSWIAIVTSEGTQTFFNIGTGAVGSNTSGINPTIVPVGDGWYRCSVSYTRTGSANNVLFSVASADNSIGYAGDITKGVYVWGAQVVKGSKPGAYNGTNAAVFGPSYVPAGAIVSNQLGQNLATYSEQFDNSAWTTGKLEVTVTPNTEVAPNGTVTADRIEATAVNNYHYLTRNVSSIIVGQVHTFSVFAKAGTSHFVTMGDNGVNYVAWFDLSNGTTGNITGNPTKNIVPVGGGWYRCSITYIAASSVVTIFIPKPDNSTLVWLGDGSYLNIWGGQISRGSSPGSYNFTVASAIGSSYVPSGARKSSQLGQNLITLSEKISSWNLGGGVAVTANAALAPDGTMTADKINFTSNAQYVNSAAASIINKAVGTKYTFSIWLWTDTKTNIGIRSYSSPGDNILEDHRTVTLTQTPTRYFLTSSVVASGSDSAVVLDLENRVVYGSDGGSGTVYAWGAQIVAGDKMGAYNKTDATAKNPTYLP